jgi:hypothetical protein
VLQCRGHEHRDARVALRPREHHRADAAAGAQCPQHLAQAAQRTGEEHQAEAADGGIEAALLHAQILAIGDPGAHVDQAGARCVVPGQRQDGRRQVRGEHLSRRADVTRDGERLLAGACGDVEHAGAGSDAGHPDHGLGRAREPRADLRAVGVPAGGGLVPLRTHGLRR